MTMSPDDQSSSSLPLNKYLASTDKRTRDKAVKSLAAFLSTPDQNALPKSEMAKLWKGIFYCYWMSDKPLVQQALSSELAELLLTISSTNASLVFLKGFWEAIVREWNGIDRLRMDKYYMLVRKFVNASFRLLVRAEWDKNALEEYNDILTCKGGPLCPEDNRVPTSLSYHLADVYLTELDKSLASSPDSNPPPAPLSLLLDPFLNLAALTNSNVTYQRIYGELLEPLFLALKPPPSFPAETHAKKRPKLLSEPAFDNIAANACLETPKEGKVEKSQVRKALLRKMFDIASGPNARETNRRKMYAVWKTAMAEENESGGEDTD
ncbi:Nop52-domain-containing protein, partial [Phellopilus nigrolimitatus]